MALRERKGHWHFRFEIQGREYSGNTGELAPEEHRGGAELFEPHARAKIAADQPAQQRLAGLRPILFGDAVETWLEWCKAEYRSHPNSWRRLAVSCTALRRAFGERLVHAIEACDLELFKARRINAGRKPVTVRHDLHALSLFFQFAERQRWASGNVVREIRIPSGASAVRMRVLTEEEERRYFAAAATHPKLYDYARLMLLTGMRNTETLRLRVRDWDAGYEAIRIEQGKTRAARRLLRVVPAASAILTRRDRERPPDAWIFPGLRVSDPANQLNNAHHRACRRAGVHFRLYDLRHTFASRAAAKGMPLTTLAAILGHSSLRCVMIYVHPSQADMDAAMLRFGQVEAA